MYFFGCGCMPAGKMKTPIIIMCEKRLEMCQCVILTKNTYYLVFISWIVVIKLMRLHLSILCY